MEKDILFDVLQNLYFGLTPVLITLVVLSFSGYLLKQVKNRRWLKGLLISPVLGLFVYVGINYHQTWTYRVEHNKPFASNVSNVSRKIIAALGFSDERPVAAKIDWIKNQVRSIPDSQLPQGTYPSLNLPSTPNPHIFVFVADAVTQQRMGVYGYERNNTPYLSATTKNSVLFSNFHANSSATYRGVLSMFSGHFAYRAGRTANDNSLCEILDERNYMTYIANAVAPLVMAKNGCAQANVLSPDGIQSQDFKTVEQSLKENSQRPIFYYAHVRGGHNPWTLPQEARIFGDNRLDIYDALIYQADQQFKRFVEWVDQLGIRENSLIIFTSDHGIGLGYHMDMSSYSHMYAHNTRIPFIVYSPGGFAGEVEDYFSQIDLTPTLAEIIGAGPKKPMIGRSFARHLKESISPQNNCVFGSAEYRHSYAVTCSDGKKLIWNVDENTLEYFVSDDPMELDNKIDAISEEEFKWIAERFAPYLALMQRHQD
jgi:arylsulfatase A-like enzyme